MTVDTPTAEAVTVAQEPRTKAYAYVDGTEVGYMTFQATSDGLIDSTRHSLLDFSARSELDHLPFQDRFAMHGEFKQDYLRRKHYQFARISLSGSRPRMDVVDASGQTSKGMLNLASNDYLNLTQHEAVKAAGIEAICRYGVGAGSVPMLAGSLDVHRKLRSDVAEFKGCEDALLFTSGFGMNYAVLSTLLRKNDLAVVDLLAHASIIEGTNHVPRRFFRHNCMLSLEKVLKSAQSKYRNCLVVVDGVYSMDGDVAPLDKILEIAHAYGALVMVDDAHATGVVGTQGRGTASHCGVHGEVDIVAGTFSKALGGVGGFVAGSLTMVSYLHTLARPFVFSTAPSPSMTCSMSEAIRVVRDEPQHREKLWRNIEHFKSRLLKFGFDLGNAETAIFPVIIGDDLKVKELCWRLHRDGIYVNQVLYPAVPAKASRLRFSLTAGLSIDELDYVADRLVMHAQDLGVV